MNREKTTNEGVVPYGLTERQWHRIQKAALRIHPETAIVESRNVYVWDPYDLDPNRPHDVSKKGLPGFLSGYFIRPMQHGPKQWATR
jgi:hypothetical protein